MMKTAYFFKIGKMLVWLVAMAMLSQGIVSCMEEDKVVTTPECAIVAFGVSSFSSMVTEKKYDSKGEAHDTIVSKTIDGSSVYFNIDQLNGRIYTVDSLAHWADVSRLVPTFSSYGNVYAQFEDDSLYYPITSGKDSLDLTKPVKLACVATDGVSAKYYTVEVFKHTNAIDTLAWSLTKTNLSVKSIDKTLCCGDRVFVFGKDAGNAMVVASSASGKEWSAPAAVKGGDIAIESIAVWNGMFYASDTEGNILCSSAGETWTKACDRKVERLLGADGKCLYAKDGDCILGTYDLATWTVQGSADMDMLPETCVSMIARPSKTNSNIQVVVMTGINAQNTDNGVAWYKLTAEDDDVNQQWAYIQVTRDNSFGLPRLGNLSVTLYNNSLYAIGLEKGAYSHLYRSDDNGVAWHATTKKCLIPADLDAAEGRAHIVAKDGKLIIIQEGGNVWQGSIQQ